MSMLNTVPAVSFKIRVRDESIAGENPYRWDTVTSDGIFRDKRVVLFALPGAFTPTCSASHLPRYDAFREAGIDDVICLSVNDAFVMNQWGLAQNAEKVSLLPDGNGEFTRKMGMLVDKTNLGFGMRSWRYSMLVNDGVIEEMFVENGYSDNCESDPYEVSDADTMLSYLRELREAA